MALASRSHRKTFLEERAMSIDCFISYASQDVSLAEKLCDFLKERGLSVWLDRERLKPGFDWYAQVRDAADSASVVLPILTPKWALSNWTKFETYAADRVVPLLFEGGWDMVSTPALQRFQYLDLAAGADGWAKLEAAVPEQLALPVPDRVSRHYASRPIPRGLTPDVAGTGKSHARAPRTQPELL